jgi:hypothetical protein
VTSLLLVAGIVATGVCFARRRTRAGVFAAYAGSLALLVGWVLSLSSPTEWPLLMAAQAFALVATFLALGPDVFAIAEQPLPVRALPSAARRSLRGGLVGATPGLALVAIPLALYQLGIAGAGAADMVFLGLPMLSLGLIMGLAFGATSRSHRRNSGPPPWRT